MLASVVDDHYIFTIPASRSNNIFSSFTPMRTTQRRISRLAMRRAKKPQNSWKWKTLTAVATLSLLTQTTAFGLLITPANTVEAVNQIAVPANGLVIEKSINSVPPAPGQLEYKIIFTNNTGNDLWSVTVDDALVQALSYVPGSSIYEYGDISEQTLEPSLLPNHTLQWTLPDALPNGYFGAIVFWVGVSAVGNDYPGYLQGNCSISNTASIAGITPTTDSPQNGTYSATSAPVPYDGVSCAQLTYYAPDLLVTKTVVEGSETPTSVQYALQYENVGNWAAFDVVLSDVLPTGLTNANIIPAPDTFDGTTATWHVSQRLAPGDSGTLNVTLTFDDLGLDCRLLTNTASIAQRIEAIQVTDEERYQEVNTTNNTTTATSGFYFGICSPTITLTKTDGLATTTKGSTLAYAIDWTIGNDDVPQLIVTDTLPAGLTFVSASNSGTYDSATRMVTWTYGPLAPGANGSEAVTVTVDATATGTITNPASAQAYQNGLPVGAGVQASDDTAVAQDIVVVPPQQTTLLAPAITIDKTANKTTTVAKDLITYSVTIKNTGTAPAENLTLTDTLPSGFVFNDFLASERTWTISPSFAPGNTTTITYGVRVNPGVTAGDYTNTATAKATGLAPVTDRATVHVDAPQVLGATTGTPTVILEKAADRDTANPGETVDFTVTVTNTGDAPATEVSISDFLPDGFTFDDETTSKAWTVGTLEAKESKSFTYTTTVSDAALEGTYTNVADVSFAEGNPIEALASVDVQSVQVLGASTLAETGADMNDLLVFASGAVLLFVSVLGFRKASSLA